VADVAVVYPGGSTSGGYGSGRLIAPGLILTAGHVVDYPTPEAATRTAWKVLLLREQKQDDTWGEPHEAELVWRGLGDLDLALLQVSGYTKLRPEVKPVFASIKWVEPIDEVRAAGFPEAWRTAKRTRDFTALGRLSMVTRHGPYGWSVPQATSPDEPPGWKGMSGAAVCHVGPDDKLYLFGVVQEVPANFSHGQLNVARLSKAFEDDKFREHLQTALGAVPHVVPFMGRPDLGIARIFQMLARIAVELLKFSAADTPTRRGQWAFVCATVLIASLGLWQELIGPLLWSGVVAPQVHTLVYSHRWVTYDPGYPFFLIKRARVELGWIRQAGFDGIITFSSRLDFAKVPQLAHEQGLSVIAGIWNPNDEMEMASAFAVRQYVDGYCIGHDGLHPRGTSSYTIEDLERTIARLRFRTSKPVTTTEEIKSYLDPEGPRLLRMGDWVFPDVHVSIRSDEEPHFLADAIRDGKETLKMATKIAAQTDRAGRPILLKMVTYPMKGVTKASLEEQAHFFVQVLENRRDAMADMPGDVGISVHSAFDISWKTGWPFFEWDPYTGLLDSNGAPRPAAKIVVERLP